MKRKLKLAAKAAAVLVLAACAKSNFSGGGAKKKADPVKPEPGTEDGNPSERTLKLACEDGQAEAKLVTEVKGQESTTVRLEGEFCGLGSATKTGKLTVLFVIDYSGSMQFNDPATAGSCGRLKAAEAIVKKLEESPDLKDAEVEVAMQAFSTNTITAAGTPAAASLADFKAVLTEGVFCSDDGGLTNYDAAFRAAETFLKPVEGSKVVYFVSDGAPSVSGDFDPQTDFFGGRPDPAVVLAAGKTSAESLRANVKDLTLNAIFLGAVSTEDVQVEDFDPETYLAEITGSKDQVRVVTSTDDLAAKIVTFETPKAAELSAESVEGQLEAAEFEGKSVALESLEAVEGRDGVYAFVTEPFELFGSAEEATENVLTLTIKAADGKVHTATAEIKFIVDETAE